jgi:hypothetical protein
MHVDLREGASIEQVALSMGRKSHQKVALGELSRTVKSAS